MAEPKIQPPPTEKDRFTGVVQRIVFHNPETGYSVMKVAEKRRGKEDVSVVGISLKVREGENIEAIGQWINDPKFGLQFKAEQIQTVTPTTSKGIFQYLSAGAVRGIGPSTARKLVDAFGDQTLAILDTRPDRLMELPGIGPKKVAQIVEGWQEQTAVRDILVYLHTHGVGAAAAHRIYKKYGRQAIAKIQENPYRLCFDIHGIGFKTADAIAASVGVAADSPLRAGAGIHHVMQEHAKSGHCCMDLLALLATAGKTLDIPEDIIRSAVYAEVGAKRLVAQNIREDVAIYLPYLLAAEKGIAAHLARLDSYGPPPWQVPDPARATLIAERQVGITLSDTQRSAVETVLANKVVVITGGPGVGKTSCLKTVLQSVAGLGLDVCLCAPTGRAAKRMTESTEMEAKTIHRLLEFSPASGDFQRNHDRPLEADFVVVDESSMNDAHLMHCLLRAIPSHASVLIVGDIDQLPSVGPGNALKDIINSEAIPTVRLTEIYRQAAGSKIIVNAHRINKGESLDLPAKGSSSDFYFVEGESIERIVSLVTSHIPKNFGFDPIRDIQVLTPMHKGPLGTKSLNAELQKVLNPPKGDTLERFGQTFAAGDKVMQLVNNYDKDVFNGDTGFITSVDKEDAILMVSFDGKTVPYTAQELEELTLAYCTTIHKSQGSEYPCVVMPMTTQHYVMLERNLLYTGVTRGKEMVVLAGQQKAIDLAIKTVKAHHRQTHLTARIRAAFGLPDASADQEDEFSAAPGQ